VNRRNFLTGTAATAAVMACEALPEDTSCDIVTWGIGEPQECPRPATVKYAPGASHILRFCEEHARCCATMPLVSIG